MIIENIHLSSSPVQMGGMSLMSIPESTVSRLFPAFLLVHNFNFHLGGTLRYRIRSMHTYSHALSPIPDLTKMGSGE